MKYAQLVMGLLIGTALGGAVVASTGEPGTGGSGLSRDDIKAIVRETISEEPTLIISSVQKYQEGERSKAQQSANDALKDKALRAEVFDAKTAGVYGTNEKRTIVQFFDYNCPACKMQHQALNTLLAKDKDIRIIFREYPIFGPTSDENSRLGLAVARLAPEKYYDFYEKMMGTKGHAEQKQTLGYIKELGLDVAAVQAESQKPEVNDIIEKNRALGAKLHIQGTPTIIVGSTIVGHAVGPEELADLLKK